MGKLAFLWKITIAIIFLFVYKILFSFLFTKCFIWCHSVIISKKSNHTQKGGWLWKKLGELLSLITKLLKCLQDQLFMYVSHVLKSCKFLFECSLALYILLKVYKENSTAIYVYYYNVVFCCVSRTYVISFHYTCIVTS